MSKTTRVVEPVELKAVPLPVKTETYTVISHGFIIDEVKRELAAAGFEVMAEEYRANNNLEVARGSYIIRRSEDPNFLMSFNWTNSYDKSTKFQCAVGGFVWENNAYVIEKEGNTFIRKHTGDADTLVKETIADKIANAEKYYLSVLDAKCRMENIKVNRAEVAKILGNLYFNFDMISIEQLSGIKKEYLKPSYVYSTDSDSLWTVYCHILTVLKSAHPKLWLHQQGFVHNYLKMNYLMTADTVSFATPSVIIEKALLNIPEVEVDPAQINLLDAIADVEEWGKDVPEKIIPKFSILSEEEIEEEKVSEEEEIEIHIESDEEYAARVATIEGEPEEEEMTEKQWLEDDVVTYTDPSGVTFIAPIVEPENFMDDFTTEEIAEVEEAKEMWTPRDDSNDLLVLDPSIISVLKNEVNNIFGYEVEIEVYEDGENYNIVTGDGQEVTVPIDYVKNLI
jgi:hypothetical protein